VSLNLGAQLNMDDDRTYRVDVICHNCGNRQAELIEKGKLASGPWKCDVCECVTCFKQRIETGQPQLLPYPFMQPLPQPTPIQPWPWPLNPFLPFPFVSPSRTLGTMSPQVTSLRAGQLGNQRGSYG
jgi:hypothetical protein